MINGWGLPGLNATMGVPDHAVPDFYNEELSVFDTSVSGENTDIQDSYNLGYVTSAFAWTGLTAGFAYMVGAEVGVVSAFLIWTSPITAVAVPGLALAHGISSLRQPGETSVEYYDRGGLPKSSGTTETSSFWPSWLWGDFETPQYNS